MKLTGMLATLAAIKGIAATSEKTAPSGKQLYEWRIYTLEGDADGLDDFFRDILIPAYNRKKIKAGAFVPYKKEGKKRRLLLFIYPDITTYHRVKRTIWNDTEFRKAAQPYFDKTAPNPAYFNFESFLCEAFDKVPSLLMPDKSRTMFELRTYHSPNEEANQRKVAMFNKDEIDVFDKVGINSVCYGEVLGRPDHAGSNVSHLVQGRTDTQCRLGQIPDTSGLAADQEPTGICLYGHSEHQPVPLAVALFTDMREPIIKKQ